MDPDNMVVIEVDDKEKLAPMDRSKSAANQDDVKVPDFKLDIEEQEQLHNDSNLMDDKKLYNELETVIEEDSRILDNTTLLPSIEEESNQSFNEQELLDPNGKYMIFAPENESLITPLNLEAQIEQDIPRQRSGSHPDQLDPKFSQLNYVNKIQILLKALIIEKEQNREFDSLLGALKQDA